MKRQNIQYLFFLFCFFANIVLAGNIKPDFHVLNNSHIKIYYEYQDSLYSKEAKDHLLVAYEEMAFDFKLNKPDTISVIISPSRAEFITYTQGILPKWTGAFASPTYNVMVVKSPRWNRTEKSFRATLVHELLHLVLHQKIFNQPVPRWLDEGLAIFYSGEQEWKTMTTMSKAAATNSLIPLQDIDQVLDFQRTKAELAYQQSFSAVFYFLNTYDIDGLRIILDGIRLRQDINKSFLLATGSTFTEFEQEWIHYVKKNYKWFWLADIDDYIWILMLILAAIAFIIIRIRNRRIINMWESPLEEQ